MNNFTWVSSVFHTADRAYEPWLPYIVTDYIKSLSPRTIFEWGSGFGTLYLCSLGAEIVSIEHDKEWYDKIKSFAEDWEIDYKLIPLDPWNLGEDKANPAHYKSGSTQLGPANFKSYASVIDSYGLFDLILIDGMARASCLYHAINHVKPGGCIVLDNTGDRPYYLEQTAHLFGGYESGWETIKFFGYGPILDYKWETTIFINKRKDDYKTK